MAAFFVVILLVIGLVHAYLWKRLVRDTLAPGWGRRAGTVAAVVLGLLVPVTLIGVRAGYVKWLAWPGYLWIALMFYLLISLLVLEVPRLVLRVLWVGRGRTGKGTKAARTSSDATNDRQSAGSAPAPAGAQPGHTGEDLQPAGSAPARTGAQPGHTGEDLQPAGSAPARTGAQPGHTGEDLQPAGSVPAPAGTASGDDRGHADDDLQPAASVPAVVGAPLGADRGLGLDAPGPADAILPTAAAGSTSGSTEQGGSGDRAGMDRRLLLARGAAIFAGLTAASVTGYGIKTATGAPRIDQVRIPIAKLPRAMDGTRLAVVSDIHLGPLTGIGHTQRITRVINSVGADLVCVVGDLVDGSVAELGRLAEPLREIESRRGAYFVTGNHEYYSGYQEWVDEVAELGIRPLRNERVEIDGLDLAGVNDLGGGEHGDPADFGKALGGRDPNRPVVLMAHQPLAARDAAPYGVDLQLSGHTHGGQMAPFNAFVKLQQPVVSGFGRVDGVPVYVTNGAGFWGPPVRVGAPPQVTVVELRVA